MKLTEKQRNVLRYIGARCASAGVRGLIKTLRVKIINAGEFNKYAAENRNFVYAFWHGSMLLGWYLNRKNNASALVSQSKDGDVLAAILEKWNYNVVRGSSSTGGSDALTGMIFLLREGFTLSITPDGPRGPIYKMKAGAVIAAKKSGAPLFLAGIGMKNKVVLKSWDQFEIPVPFSKAVVVFSDPVFIDDNLSYEETDKIIIECEEKLNMLQKEALKFC